MAPEVSFLIHESQIRAQVGFMCSKDMSRETDGITKLKRPEVEKRVACMLTC